MTTPDAAALADQLRMPVDVVTRARANVTSGAVVLLAVSGKLASGKDTVAERTMAALGHADAAHFLYANTLKDEVDTVIARVRSAASADEAARAVARDLGVPFDQALEIALVIQDDVTADLGLHARSRTPSIRTALQFWGTEVRRAQDSDYWVRSSLREAVAAAAAGTSIFYTDCRFPNEVVWAQQVGFLVARLDITAATQQARLDARDGLPPDPSALTHPSETALDDFPGFDVVLDNNGELDDTVKALSAALLAHALSRAPRPVRVAATVTAPPGLSS